MRRRARNPRKNDVMGLSQGEGGTVKLRSACPRRDYSSCLKMRSLLRPLFLLVSLSACIFLIIRFTSSNFEPNETNFIRGALRGGGEQSQKNNADELPSMCRKYFQPSFPINLTKAIERNLGTGHTKLFARDEIVRRLCEHEYKTASIMLVYNNTLYVSKNDTRFARIQHFNTIETLYEQQRRVFPKHNFAKILFKWWAVDNPIHPCFNRGDPTPDMARNIVGTVGWSRCPPPYCSMSIVVPSVLPGEAGDEGRMNVHKTFKRLSNCTSIPIDKRPAQAEWRGTRSGHHVLPFWDSPSEQCIRPQCQWNATAAIARKKDVKYFIGQTRKNFVKIFENSALPVNASYKKREICNILSENRLLYSISGFSYASNFYDNMLSGAVTLKQDYPAWSYFEAFFEPDQHYILGRRDLSDFEEISRHLLELSPEDAEFHKFRQIAQSSRERATLLAAESPLLQSCFYNELFRKYSSMLEPEATIFDPKEWIRVENFL